MLSTTATLGFAPPSTTQQQLNTGVHYAVSNPLEPKFNEAGYGFRGAYFEVDSPKIVSQYSQVVWPGGGLPPVELPADVVQKFDNKTIFITGWEVDIWRDTPSGHVSVPCYESYNHHYVSYLKGKGADLEVRPRNPTEAPGPYGHGGPQHVFKDNGKGSGKWPTNHAFSEHNGNEHRQTYHALANGFGVALESPTHFVFNPMQINTRNPDGSGERCGEACPLPRRQNAWKGAKWSGLLECPCGSRMIKTFDHHLVRDATPCTYNSTIPDADECFAAAAEQLKSADLQNITVSADASLPAGCSVQPGTPRWIATFNKPAVPSSATSCADVPGGGSCVCRAPTGYINGHRFDAGCIGEPLSELVKDHNPTCDLNLYDGGMNCCGGLDPNSTKRFLLDADQPIPPLVDEVYFRWRFYYEDEAGVTTPPRETYHVEWQFGHIEYSVPKAPEGTPPEQAVHTITSNFTVADMVTLYGAQCGGSVGCDEWGKNNGSRPIQFLMLGFHCHSPACLGGVLLNADTGEEYCRVTAMAGHSAKPQDEEEYLWLPPCQYGAKEEGLRTPPVVNMSTKLRSIKWANSSVAHFGVMAIWQGRAAYAVD